MPEPPAVQDGRESIAKWHEEQAAKQRDLAERQDKKGMPFLKSTGFVATSTRMPVGGTITQAL